MTSKRINLWSSPRNISTALMYSFANRDDTAVVDEPLYAHYLNHQPTEAIHPGRAAILASMEHDGERVVEQMLTTDYGKPNVVFKQMTHHLVGLDRAFLEHTRNVLLIRNPREILRSFGEVVEEVTAEDIGIPQQYELFRSLRAAGKLDAVVDARLLLENPASVLEQLCDRLDLPFSDRMLSWEAGARPEDGVWAPYWYGNVHKSTGFRAYREREFVLDEGLEGIAEVCAPFYLKMLDFALR